MSQETNIRQLVINKLTDAQYEQAVKNADELYLTPDTDSLPSQTGNSGKYLTTNGTTTSWASVPAGTVTSVRVQATSPVQSSTSSAQSTSLNTTISLANGYGDTKNPYASKTANTVLAAPNGSDGVPTFRVLEKADIPLASETAESGGTTTSLVTTGEKYTWNSKQDTISDLSTIRDGASAGATAVQPGDLATVATSGSYNDLTNKPTIPAAQVNSDWNATSGVAQILNKPTIPTVGDAEIEIQKNGTKVDSFTTNQSGNKKTINITVPTNNNQLTNGAGYITSSDIPTNVSAFTNDAGYLTSHQNIKTLNTNNTTGQTASDSENIAGSGTINLHKVSKTGSYNDLLNKPTIDTALSTTSTNAVQNKIITTELNKKIHYGDILVNPNGKTLYMTKLDDTLYRANKRHTVTLTNFNSSMQNPASLFDMNYDTKCGIDKGNIGIINISGNINLGMNYPYGYLFISFYHNNTPLSVDQVSIRIYQNWSGHNIGWVDVGHPEIDYESGRPYVMKKFLQYYGMQQIEISIDNTEGTGTEGEKRIDVTQVEFFCNRTRVSSLPVLTKLGGDTIYGNLTIPTADGSFIGHLTGNADTADKATKDASGNTITTTYATKSELPTVNNKTITIQKNSTTVDSFTLNQSTDKTINISVPTIAADVGAVPTTRTVNGKALSSDISLTASDVGAISSHQSIKTLKTDNTTAQTTSSSETIAGSGTINLHKVSKTGSYNDLLNKPTIPATNVIPATTTANKVLVSTTTSGTAKWSNFSTAGLLKTNTSGVVSVDATSYGTYSKPSGGIPASDLAESYYLASNPSGYTSNAGTVTSVRVQATSPVQSSTSTAQSSTLNTTISLADGYGDTKNPYASKTKNYVLAAPSTANGAPTFRALTKADIPLASETAASGGTTTSLVTTGEKYTWNNKQNALTAQTAYTSKGSATKVPQITTNTLGQVTGITEVDITHPTELPSQTGQSGKFLTTNGSTVSWAATSTNIDNSTITKNGSNQIQTVGYKDVRTNNTLKTWTGTRTQYDAIVTKDPNTLYNITDDTDTTAAMLELLYPVGAVYIGTMDVCPLAALGIGSWEKIAEDQVLQGSSLNHNAGTTIAAGLPNITGSINRPGQNNTSGDSTTNYLTGSFYFDSSTYSRRNTSESGTGYLLKFDASRSNSIYGNSSTVQPPAFVVNIWRRIS